VVRLEAVPIHESHRERPIRRAALECPEGSLEVPGLHHRASRIRGDRMIASF
jgi:hypothetical protein